MAVSDLAIHPREHDLVIATHGRALYVLDDIRPLRTMTEETLAKPLHLYEVADARQFTQGPQAGGFGLVGSSPGENRAYGALLHLLARRAHPKLPLPDTEKERARKEEERMAKRAAAAKEQPKTEREMKAPEGAEGERSPDPARGAGRGGDGSQGRDSHRRRGGQDGPHLQGPGDPRPEPGGLGPQPGFFEAVPRTRADA